MNCWGEQTVTVIRARRNNQDALQLLSISQCGVLTIIYRSAQVLHEKAVFITIYLPRFGLYAGVLIE